MACLEIIIIRYVVFMEIIEVCTWQTTFNSFTGERSKLLDEAYQGKYKVFLERFYSCLTRNAVLSWVKFPFLVG